MRMVAERLFYLKRTQLGLQVAIAQERSNRGV
jgi:hypothetical protein